MGCLARLRWVPPAPSRATAWWLVRWRARSRRVARGATVSTLAAPKKHLEPCSVALPRRLLRRPSRATAFKPRLVARASHPGSEVTVCLLHPISEGQPGALCILKIAEAVHLARSLDNTPSRQLPSSSIACKSPVVCTASTARLRPSCPSAHAYLVCHGQNLQCCRLTHACMLWQDGGEVELHLAVAQLY